MSIKWNSKMEDALKESAKQGRTSAEIADILYRRFGMPVSRNAVIGKAHRLKINFSKSEKLWYEKPISYLIDEWKKGTGATEIAKYYKVSRSTVSKKARDLGLEVRSAKQIARANKPRIEQKATIPQNKFRTDFPNPEAVGLLFMELQRDSCRFVVGEGGNDPYLFCGAPIPMESPVPYCEKCRSVVYVPARYQLARMGKE
jgi:hypothetical protein